MEEKTIVKDIDNQNTKDEYSSTISIDKSIEYKNNLSSKMIKLNEDDLNITNEMNKNNNHPKNSLEENMNFSNKKYEQIIFEDSNKKSNIHELFGLRNIGNSCYMNSILQILFRTPGFIENLRLYYDSQNYKEDPLINSLIDLYDNPNSKIALEKIKQEMSDVDISYGKYVQNDSQMFGIDLINLIIASMKGETSSYSSYYEEEEVEERIEAKYNNFIITNSSLKLSPFEKMFLFNESFIKINKNNIYNSGFENWLNINLTFPQNKTTYTIEELLDYKYINLEKIFLQTNSQNEINSTIQDDNKFSNCQSFIFEKSFIEKINFENIKFFLDIGNNSDKKENKSNQDNFEDIKKKNFILYVCIIFQAFCETIKSYWNKIFSNETSKEVNDKSKFEIRQLASLPNVLIITINRAILGKPYFNNKLKFSQYLNLSNYLDKFIFSSKSNEVKYKLYAINACSSLFMNGGHYLSYVEIEEGKWYKFDDETVSSESPDFSGNRYVVGLYYIKI